MRVPTEFLETISVLNQGGVRFVIIGGIAMRLHGSAHITEDLDVCYSRKAEDLPALIKTLSAHRVRLRGVPDDLPFIFDTQTLRNTANLTLTTDLGALDILGDAAGVDSFEGLWERSIITEVEGETVRVASIADLLSMKRAANRPKDQNHILELMALQKLLETPDAEAENLRQNEAV